MSLYLYLTLSDRFNRISLDLREAGDDCEQRESPTPLNVPEAPAPAMNPISSPSVGVSDPGNAPQDAGMHNNILIQYHHVSRGVRCVRDLWY